MIAMKTILSFVSLIVFSTTLFAQSNEPEEHPNKRLHKIKVMFHNESGKDVFAAVTYNPYTTNGSNKTYTTQGWYTIKKGEKVYLFDTPFNEFYYYVETNKDFWGNKKIWKGEYGFNVRGSNYYFRKWTIKSSEVVENKEQNESVFTLRLTK